MAQVLRMVLVLGLLTGTAAAIAVTEGLKLQTSPIKVAHVDAVFSPVCGCTTKVANIKFRLVKAGKLTMRIETLDRKVVRTLVHDKREPRSKLHFTWDGRADDHRLLPDGTYQIRVLLSGEHRSIVLSDHIRIDTHPPVVRLTKLSPTVVTPNGPKRERHVAASYRLSEPAHVSLLINGVVRVRSLFKRLTGTLDWYGQVDGKPVSPGRYRLRLVARDIAGNLSAARPRTITVAEVLLARHTIRARARTKFGVRVATGSGRVHWQLGKQHGTVRPGLLVIRAGHAGRYTLVVTAGGHSDRAVVQVVPR